MSSSIAQNHSSQSIFQQDQSNNMRNYLIRVANEISQSSLHGLNTLDEWKSKRQQYYNELVDMMGLVDVPLIGERPPLNIKITGTIQRQGFQIKKLYFDSLPKLYVAANLYVPDNITKPVPGILYVCGHAHTQKVRYQAHGIQFAKLGFVCLIIETIQWGELRGEHWGCYANGWFHWYSRGYTPAGVELWNGIRGLDLLAQLPEVDEKKMGVTGISGGGAQTWFIAAIDNRVKAAAPVCGTGTIAGHVQQRTIDNHCDCMMPINTYKRDLHHIGALISPRPLLVASAKKDAYFSIESVREVCENVRHIYDLYGKANEITLIETPGGHAYHEKSKYEVFSFFMKQLKERELELHEIINFEKQELLSENDLRVFVDGPLTDDLTTKIQDSFIKLADIPNIKNKKDLFHHREKVMQFLRAKAFRAFPKQPVPLDLRLEFQSKYGDGKNRRVLSFVSERDWRLKIDIHWKNINNPTLLILKNSEEKREESEAKFSDLINDWNLVFFETRGVGETGWNPAMQWHIRRSAAWTGRTIASMRVYDVLRCLHALRFVDLINHDNISVAANEDMCAIALYAALVDSNINGLILKNPPYTQNQASNPDESGSSIEMLNVLRITDLCQIACLLFPRYILFWGEMPVAYKWTYDVYKRLGKKDALKKIKSLAEIDYLKK
jgi:hypothetical protein